MSLSRALGWLVPSPCRACEARVRLARLPRYLADQIWTERRGYKGSDVLSMENTFLFLALTVVLSIYILLPAWMTKRRQRSVLGWVCISVLFSPVVAIIALLVLGVPYRDDG